jgi:DnaJ-domain-containing protein 1
MGIWSRLGSVINSYINDLGEQNSSRPFHSSSGRFRSNDPDFEAAYEELDDYLNQKEARYNSNREHEENARYAGAKLPPEELRPDFEYLGVPFGADAGECKAAYKKLLKIHHPDRHAGHEGNFKKATERSAKINAAWDKINKWRNSGSAT